MLLSQQTPDGTGGAIVTRSPSGRTGVLARDVDGPGGIASSGGHIYFTTGNSLVSGLVGRTDGTVVSVDPETGSSRVVARGLTQPNGLAVLPDGDLVVSRDAGEYTGLTLVRTNGTRARIAPGLTSTNGLWWDAVRQRLLVTTTFDAVTRIAAVDPARPERWRTVVALDGFGPLNAADDLTTDADGHVYAALNASANVVRIDAKNRARCVIADRLPLVSSVRFGAGPGWDSKSLYATSLLGGLYRLSPR